MPAEARMTTEDDQPPGLVWRSAPPDRPLTGLTVLVVEDSRVASEAVRLICLRSGARIRRADCLGSARRHLATYRPAVALVDMALPDGDGTELIATFHALDPRVPAIIAISGDPSRREEALAAGAQAFLAKPIESVGLFQQTVLRALPASERPLGPRAVPNDFVVPDAAALRDDLLHARMLMEAGPEATSASDYLGGFLAGVARSARDAALEDAAERMLDAARPDKPEAFARLDRLVRHRLTELAPL